MADLRLGKAQFSGFSPPEPAWPAVSCYLQGCSATAFAYVPECKQLPHLLGEQIPQGLGLVCSEHHPPDQPPWEVEGSQVILSHSGFAVRRVQHKKMHDVMPRNPGQQEEGVSRTPVFRRFEFK